MQINTHENLKDIVKYIISCFIHYSESLRVVDVSWSCPYSYMSWIQFWIRVHTALQNLHQNSPLTLRHGFWAKTCVNVQALEASNICRNWNICKEFDVNNYHGRRASNYPPSSFRIAVNYHKGIWSFCVLKMRHMRSQYG